MNTIDGLSLLAEQYNYGYLVCSAQDLVANHYLKARQFKRICPGIRPAWSMSPDDQKRTATPKEAINSGADLLVMGRPLKIGVQDASIDEIIEAVERTNTEINQ